VRLDRAAVSAERVSPAVPEAVRSRDKPKAELSPSYRGIFPFSPFAPRSLPASPLLWAVRLRRKKTRGYPRFLDLSFLTRRPQPPRRARRLHSPVASPSVTGFIRFDRLATPIRLTRPNRVRFTAARKFASQGFVTRIAPVPHACSATLMNGLFQGKAPFSFRDKPGFAWRTEATEADAAGEVFLSLFSIGKPSPASRSAEASRNLLIARPPLR